VYTPRGKEDRARNHGSADPGHVTSRNGEQRLAIHNRRLLDKLTPHRLREGNIPILLPLSVPSGRTTSSSMRRNPSHGGECDRHARWPGDYSGPQCLVRRATAVSGHSRRLDSAGQWPALFVSAPRIGTMIFSPGSLPTVFLVQSYLARIPAPSVNVSCGKSVSGETGNMGKSS
jgi:hypothetical protein